MDGLQIEMPQSRTVKSMVAKGWMRVLPLEGKVQIVDFSNETKKLEKENLRYRVESEQNLNKGLYVKRDDYGFACYVLDLF